MEEKYPAKKYFLGAVIELNLSRIKNCCAAFYVNYLS